jgi:ribosomal protein L11 methyltransferase
LADRHWPALLLETAAPDPTGTVDGWLSALLDEHEPVAIEDLIPPPLPPGGLWDPTAPPPPPDPLTRVHWRATFRDHAMRAAAMAAIADALPQVRMTPVDLPDEDWAARSQAALTAVVAGRFVVAPPWDQPAAPAADQIVLVIEPSMGFGTGHHATTRLCLRALSPLVLDGQRVLDIGTGSGVLAMAASRLGAHEIVGLDIDADAIAAAEQSAALNILPVPVRFRTGDFHDGTLPPADLVVANLTAAMLTRSRDALRGLVAPAGSLIVSGFMHDEADGVLAAFGPAAPAARYDEDGWVALHWAGL